MGLSILPQWFRKLDTVVKLGLGVFIGAFVQILCGMLITRPDRSIPPYSVGSPDAPAGNPASSPLSPF
jgi:hypothetical protein